MTDLTPVIAAIGVDAFGRRVVDDLRAGGDAGLGFVGMIEEVTPAALDGLHVLFVVSGSDEAETAAGLARAAQERELSCLVCLAIMAIAPSSGAACGHADGGAWLQRLACLADAVFPLPLGNEVEAAAHASDVVRAIVDLLLQPGLVQFDYADLVMVLRGRGEGRIATGSSSGVDRARRAARATLASPLLLGRKCTDFAAGLLIARVAPDVTIEELYAGFETLGFRLEDHRIRAWQALPHIGGGAEIELTGLLAGRCHHG